MKVEPTVKLGDILKIAAYIVMITGFVVTDRMDIAALRANHEADHVILGKLSDGFSKVTAWQAATDVRLTQVERDRGDFRSSVQPDMRHGGTMQALKDGQN